MQNRFVISLLLTITILSSGAAAQNRGVLTTDPAFYAVSFVEVMPGSKAAAVAALKQYRDASRKDEGFVSLELFEQIGWPAHFALVEKWADQKAFETHGMAAHTKQMLMKLEPIRVMAYDQRPYRTLEIGPPSAQANDRAIVVLTHVDIGGRDLDVPALLKRMVEDGRKDEGNVRLDVLQGATRPNHFTVVEVWQSQKAFDGHAAAAHTRQFRETVNPVLGSPMDQRLFKVLE
jgi:quinol monooxygenase YgiN